MAALGFVKAFSFTAPQFLQGKGNPFEQDGSEQRKTACRVNNYVRQEKMKKKPLLS